MKGFRHHSHTAPEENHRRAAHPEGLDGGVDTKRKTNPGGDQASDRETHHRKKEAGDHQAGTDDPGRKSDCGAKNGAGKGRTVRRQVDAAPEGTGSPISLSLA